MKIKLLILIVHIYPVFCSGQIHKTEVGAIYEPYCGYRNHSLCDVATPDDIFIGLIKENGKYYLKQTEVEYMEGINECTEDSTLTLVPVERNSVFLFSHFEGYNRSPIEAIDEGKEITVLPGNRFDFTHNKTNYTLHAGGELGDSDIQNYTLSFCKEGNPINQTLAAHEYLQSTIVIILFIGDLDGDGEPDIILDSGDNYENRRIRLFLSSTKKENELLHLEAEKFDWFDC